MTLSKPFSSINQQSSIIRLTALWALHESALGGILHLFRTPFAGVFLAGIAVILIALIAHFSKNPFKEITKALAIVLVIKLLLSPHSPITAYLAGVFQAFFGAIVYSIIPNFKVASFIFGLVGLLESAFQKLITLTLIFGKSLWESIDAFSAFALKSFSFINLSADTQASQWLILAYLSIYTLAGILVGTIAGRMPEELMKAQNSLSVPQVDLNLIASKTEVKKKNAFWKNPIFVTIALILIFLAAFQFLVPDAPRIFSPLFTLARVIILLGIWYLFLAPLFLKLMKKILKQKETKYRKDIDEAVSFLPILKQLVVLAWKETKSQKGIKRIKDFIVKSVSYSLIYKNDGKR